MGGVALRPYQVEIEDEARKYLAAGEKKILVVAPTGSGKTRIFADIAQKASSKSNRVMILVHRQEILEQTLEKLYELGVVSGQVAQGRPMTRDSVQVAMVGTLIRRLSLVRRPDLILADECHHSVSNSWSRILDYWRDVPRMGFTATPERLDGRGLGEMFNVMIEGPSIADLVDQGYLSRPVLFRPPHEIDAKYHVKRGDFSQDEQEQAMSKRAIVGDVIDHYRKHFDGLPVVCFCVSVRHSRLMAEQFIAAGYRAVVVEGGMPKPERKAALSGLADGSINVVCSCDVISEGVDVPVMAGAILLRRTASLALYLQQAGRALRLSPGKDDAIILDHAGNYHLHGHVLERREWSLEAKSRKERGEKPPSIVTCPMCYGVWPGGVMTCPACGYEFQERAESGRARPLRVIEGELIEAGVDRDEAASMAQLYARAMAADNKTRQKMLLGAAMRATDKRVVRELAKAVGYREGWSEWAWAWRLKKSSSG